MATKKVGIYRKYHAGVPKDPSGQPLPKSPWPKKRLFIWAVRWFGADGNRYSKSFRNRKEAEAFAETKPSDVRSGRGDPPPGIRLREFVKEHERVMKGNVAASTLGLHLRALDLLAEQVGWDRPLRKVPLPDEAVSLLAKWHAEAPEGCPYVFMEDARWKFYRQRLSAKAWRTGQDLVNNQLRRFKTLCRRAGVGPYTIHDLRRSCITNWARRLPTHIVQKLAGHSDIQTTETYYLSVQLEDLSKARRMQSELIGDILSGAGTDPLLTHFYAKSHKRGLKRCFPAPKEKDGKL